MASLLHERRRALHARIVEAIERLYPDRLAEHVERLAHHAFRAERWDKAVDYLRQAGRARPPGARRTVRRSASSSRRWPRSGTCRRARTTPGQAIDLRFELHRALARSGERARVGACCARPEQLAEALGDRGPPRSGVGGAAVVLVGRSMPGPPSRGRASGLWPRRCARRRGRSQYGALPPRCQTTGSGDYRRACRAAAGRGRRGRAAFRRTALGGGNVASGLARVGWLAWGLAELGRFGGQARRGGGSRSRGGGHPGSLADAACVGLRPRLHRATLSGPFDPSARSSGPE